jgi:hypothetical protein
VSLEEQLRNDAQSLREVGWFNRAIMMDAAANEIQKLNERINRLKEAGNELMYDNDDMANINRWHKAKEAKP